MSIDIATLSSPPGGIVATDTVLLLRPGASALYVSSVGAVAAAATQPGRITTTDATPAVLLTMAPGSPSGTLRLTGQVIARNTATGDSAVWDVAVAAKVSPTAGALFGTSAISVFIEDASMSGCMLAASASPSGISVTATGLAGASIIWACSFSTPLEA